MKTITIFNHKGGVSKTTTTFHLGWKLGQLGKKVLLVDADPQCNLTGLMLGEKFDDYYNGPQSKNNIMDGVKPTFDGRPIPIKVVECVQSPDNKNVYLLPGHMDLSQFEPTLGLALNSNNAVVTLQNLPGSFYSLIELCAQQYDIDYVLIDMNPGLSSINQSLFMSSDGFIVPMNPDPFSLMALKTLTKVLPRWKKWAENSRGLFDEATYRLPNCEMQFLGAIMQRFNLTRFVKLS
ncbi:ParA family protein [Lactiplantibacillus pentosus]|uniref:ParA family protein n=1 Tax=Lactiplantibacillus pentosus TaxID=1589 RepID=UPI00259B6D73|nr:ParA family protein [Lactiplantibacillus pentosus]WFC03225.1 ParA family protein [Lactiplantibacillus pentosus]